VLNFAKFLNNWICGIFEPWHLKDWAVCTSFYQGCEVARQAQAYGQRPIGYSGKRLCLPRLERRCTAQRDEQALQRHPFQDAVSRCENEEKEKIVMKKHRITAIAGHLQACGRKEAIDQEKKG
jgi:hypothetical protein